ncbi:MAG: hypothetical protein HQL33_02975 [Alphaproteobacteria bacterium]|nr:hypothetical protein [Alphaproteobacteria bacterium]
MTRRNGNRVKEDHPVNKVVIPAKAGIQAARTDLSVAMDPRFRGGDEEDAGVTKRTRG